MACFCSSELQLHLLCGSQCRGEGLALMALTSSMSSYVYRSGTQLFNKVAMCMTFTHLSRISFNNYRKMLCSATQYLYSTLTQIIKYQCLLLWFDSDYAATCLELHMVADLQFHKTFKNIYSQWYYSAKWTKL